MALSSLALLAAVAALSIPVGLLAAVDHESFNWEVASIFGTALGTTALAGFTGALAFTTSGDVRATWELAELTRRDQDARERPLVIQQDAEVVDAGNPPMVKVRLRNVGLGPALRIELRVRYEAQPTVLWKATRPSITPQETDEFTIRLTFPDPAPEEIKPDAFRLSGKYLDRSLLNEYEIVTDWGEATEEATAARQA